MSIMINIFMFDLDDENILISKLHKTTPKKVKNLILKIVVYLVQTWSTDFKCFGPFLKINLKTFCY